LSQQSEKAFFNDKRFWIPLHAFNVLETLAWVWQLVLFSDNIKINSYIFQGKPETWPQFLVFSWFWGFFAGLNAIAGHELLHKRETSNKIAGTWAYTKFMYSHFLEEHIQGHHKTLGTPEDPATAYKGENVYHFVVRSAIGSHINTWNRETRKIKKKYGNDVPFYLIVLNNKMTFYFLIHSLILATIYYFLGFSSLKYQLVYTLWGIWYLETVNYIEHYGI